MTPRDASRLARVVLSRLGWRPALCSIFRAPSSCSAWDSLQRAPAAQAGQRAAAPVRVVDPPQPGRAIAALSDDFSGSTLSSRWRWVRQPATGTVRVTDGALRFATQDADLHPPTEPLASPGARMKPGVPEWTRTASWLVAMAGLA